MIKIKVLRHAQPVNKSQLGDLFIDGQFICYTLEDVVRPKDEPKVFGETAIDEGTYKVIISRSNRFSKLAGHDVYLPELLDVPNFAGVRIHSGNKPQDTEGCLLLGTAIAGDTITGSRIAMDKFMPLISTVSAGIPIAKDDIEITIENFKQNIV